MIRSKSQWMGIGVALGAGIGAAMSSATHMIAWLPIGIGVGLAIGSAMANRQASCQPGGSQPPKVKG
jgi:hypothetical protein